MKIYHFYLLGTIVAILFTAFAYSNSYEIYGHGGAAISAILLFATLFSSVYHNIK